MFSLLLVLCSFSLLYCVPLYGCVTIRSPILLLMKIMVVCSSGLLRKSCCEYSITLFVSMFIFLLGAELVSYMVSLCLYFCFSFK